MEEKGKGKEKERERGGRGKREEKRRKVERNNEHLCNASEQTPQLKQSLRHLSDAPSRVSQPPPSPAGVSEGGFVAEKKSGNFFRGNDDYFRLAGNDCVVYDCGG